MDEKVDEEGLRRFYIAYKDGLFKAYEYIESRGAYTLREVDYGLEELLRKCKLHQWLRRTARPDD